MKRTSGSNKARPHNTWAPALLIALGVTTALHAQTLQLSKEYIRLGGRILAIEQDASPGDTAPVYEGWAYLNHTPTSGWVVVGAGDFDRNGVPDLVYMNTSTRQVTVNYFGGAGGAQYLGYAYLNSSGNPGWTVTAVADFNGDGVPDLVWQNDSTHQVTVNYYGGAGGATLTGWKWLNQAGGTAGYTVVAAADFDGNATPDLVWENLSSGQVTVDYYSYVSGSPTYTSTAWLSQSGYPGWTVRGAIDMNGDGVPDLIWQNNSTGQVTVHFYGGAGGAVDQGWGWLHQASDNSGWRVAAVADFDGNGTPDLVWQQLASPNAVSVNYYGPA